MCAIFFTNRNFFGRTNKAVPKQVWQSRNTRSAKPSVPLLRIVGSVRGKVICKKIKKPQNIFLYSVGAEPEVAELEESTSISGDIKKATKADRYHGIKKQISSRRKRKRNCEAFLQRKFFASGQPA